MHRVEKIRSRRRCDKERRRTPPEPGLEDGRVYVAPGGEELVAAVAPGGRHLLYHPLVWAGRAWVVNMPVSYVVTEEGHIPTRTGQGTGWRIEDLVNTRRATRKK